MSGLFHYKNNAASMKNWEPVYTNLFEAQMRAPAAIGEDMTLELESIRKIGGLDAIEKNPALVEQIYRGAKRRYAGAFPDSTTIDLSFEWEVNLDDNNSMYVFKKLRNWTDLIYDPLTSSMTKKSTYAGGPLIISMFNKAGDVFRQWKFPVIFPMSPVGGLSDLDYSSGATIFVANITFAADYWEDSFI